MFKTFLKTAQYGFLVHLKYSLTLVGYSDLTILSIKVNEARATTLKVHREIAPAAVARIGFIHALIHAAAQISSLNKIGFTGLRKPACLRP
jgi:heme exporter protein D